MCIRDSVRGVINTLRFISCHIYYVRVTKNTLKVCVAIWKPKCCYCDVVGLQGMTLWECECCGCQDLLRQKGFAANNMWIDVIHTERDSSCNSSINGRI